MCLVLFGEAGDELVGTGLARRLPDLIEAHFRWLGLSGLAIGDVVTDARREQARLLPDDGDL